MVLCKKSCFIKNDVIKDMSDNKKKPIIPYHPRFKFIKFLLTIFENPIP